MMEPPRKIASPFAKRVLENGKREAMLRNEIDPERTKFELLRRRVESSS